MAQYPYRYSNNKTEHWLSGEDTFSVDRGKTSFFNTVLASAAVASGFIPTKTGNVWDYYLRGIRAIEEYSPSQILKTFQVSNFLSQFESVQKTGYTLSSSYLKENYRYAEYLSSLIGPITRDGKLLDPLAEIQKQGVTLSKGKLLFAETGEVALPWASSFRIPKGSSANLPSAYATAIGSPKYFGKKDLPEIGKFSSQIIGGKNLPQHIWRQASAIGTEYVGRFNRLLQAPAEMEPLKSLYGKIEPFLTKLPGFKHGFAVKEDTGLKMLGKLSLKYGVYASALGLAYQTADWTVRNTDLLDQTIFAEGITTAGATLAVKTNLLLSQTADIFGLHKYREAQEEIAPGSTSLLTLAAFPMIGAMSSATTGYAAKVIKMAGHQISGKTATEARQLVDEGFSKFAEETLSGDTVFGRALKKLGAQKDGEFYLKLFGKIGPGKLSMLTGAAIGGALTLPFLPGALIPGTRPEELERIYSGRQEVAVKKSRYWLFGRTEFEGEKIDYYRPHWFPRMLQRSKETALYGEDLSPIKKWWKREFTYDLEERNYYTSPTPITALPFEDVPFIGPVLAATLGRLIKPEKLMHTEHWLSSTGEMIAPEGRYGERIATELGETPGGVAVSPYDSGMVFSEQMERFKDMIGLPGFALATLKEKFTGSREFNERKLQLESSRRVYGAERGFYDLSLGDPGNTELIRRLYPNRSREYYNPIPNLAAPSWLPGPGDRSPDFHHGSYYTTVPEGELRLPGPGYIERFPELKGLSPEEYPLIHKYKILADVAQYSEKFKQHQRIIRAERKKSTWTEYDEELYKSTEEQLKEKSKRLRFQEYKYTSPMGENRWGSEEQSDLISTLNKMHIEQREAGKDGVFGRFFGGYWEMLSHNSEMAMDQLTPISPAAKFVHARSAVESYERTQVYGTKSAFWQHPIENFIRPFLQLSGKSFGFTDIPDKVQERRDIEQYFDVLKYVKSSRLSRMARMSGDYDAVKEFEAEKHQTLFGINPYTYDFSSIFKALPRRDRDYFNSFAEASTVEERAKILELVPENQKSLYAARWQLQFANEVEKAKKTGILTEAQAKEADDYLSTIRAQAQGEGLPKDKQLLAEYLETRLEGENYGDWYRRTKLLPQMQALPGPDWVGWSKSANLEDIKLKIVQRMGENIHDYDLWRTQEQKLTNKPYIDEAAIEPIVEPDNLSESEMHSRINQLFVANQMRPNVFTRTIFNNRPSIDVDIEQDIDTDQLIKGMIS